MNRVLRKTLTWILTLCMVISMFPLTAFAAESTNIDEGFDEGLYDDSDLSGFELLIRDTATTQILTLYFMRKGD